MYKANSIKGVLNFYVNANKLKTNITDIVNNYSSSDNLFGAITLAVAFNSEFKQQNDLSKVIKMMVIDEFKKVNPNYNFRVELPSEGPKLSDLVSETNNFETNESKEVFRFKMMDQTLTNYISEYEGKLLPNEFIKRGAYLITPPNIKDNSQYEEIFNYYYLNTRLKKKERSGWDKTHWNIKSERIERVSEHIVSTILLALILDNEFEFSEEIDLSRNVDIDKVIKILAIHELGETLIGDITPFDGITPKEKEELEHIAMQEALEGMTDKEKLYDLLMEFDERISNESYFAYFCDKLEADLQSKFYQDTGLHRTLDDQENNKVSKQPIYQELINNGATTAFDIWYAYDRKIYNQNCSLYEFANLLEMARDNDITKLSGNIITEKVQIDKRMYDKLTTSLAESINEIKKLKEIDGITIFSLQDIYEENNRIITFINVVLSPGSPEYSHEEGFIYQKLFERLNRLTDFYEHYGIEVRYTTCRLEEFKNLSNPSSIYRSESFERSKVLYDKTGEITRFINQEKDEVPVYPFYNVEYIPPIDEEIKLKLN